MEGLQQIADAPHEEAAAAAFRVALGGHPQAARAEPHVRALASAIRDNPALQSFLSGALARLAEAARDPKTVAAVVGLLGSVIPGAGPVVGPLIGILTSLAGGDTAPAQTQAQGEQAQLADTQTQAPQTGDVAGL